MKKIFDLDKLVSITIEGKQKYPLISYKEPIKGWKKIFSSSPGFYDLFDRKISIERILSDGTLMAEENEVYYKPKVILRFVDGSEAIKRFDTFSQASKYGYDIASKNITSKLEIKD